jgi:tetratricopeptide (TPR) repeat protein
LCQLAALRYAHRRNGESRRLASITPEMSIMPARARILLLAACLTAALFAGCASTPSEPPDDLLRQAQQVGWSFKAMPNRFIVSVSPAGGTLRIAGSVGTVIGAGVDETVNDRYRQKLADNLGAYDPAMNFEGRLQRRLVETLGPELEQVRALPSSAGYASLREARQARLESLAKRGYGAVLDLAASFGLYGPEAVLAVKVEGDVYELPRGRRVWGNTLKVTSDPALVYRDLGTSTGGLGLNLSDPRLSVEKEAVNRWFEDGGEPLRNAFEEAVSGVTSAVLCELGLADEALGRYYLGRMALADGDAEEALADFDRALELGGPSPQVMNTAAVALARLERRAEAIALLGETADQFAAFGPAWMNLAWLLHREGGSTAEARAAYARGLELGQDPVGELEELSGD